MNRLAKLGGPSPKSSQDTADALSADVKDEYETERRTRRGSARTPGPQDDPERRPEHVRPRVDRSGVQIRQLPGSRQDDLHSASESARASFAKGEMRSRPVILGEVRREDASQMPFPEHNHLVQTFARD
jgi:hypothetical protein